MQRRAVSSSNIRSIGWENSTPKVELHDGGGCRYSGVPESVFHASLNTYSKGSSFHDHIRNRYPCWEVARC